ncbi:hypothetical protein MAR_006392, partial [Mya arenaria]
METSTLFEDSFVDTFDVLSSSGSSIQVGWKLKAANIPLVRQFQVHYQKVASQYIQYGPLLHANEREYEVEHLVADTYYKICLVVYRSNTTDYRECTDASTTNWQLPVSVGSSIGAMLALSVIVLIVLLSRCKVPLRYRGKKSKSSTRYDTIPSMYRDDQQFECSETVTHGNDDDFVSEFDDEAFYEVPLHDHTRSMRTVNPDKSAIQNGQCRCHVHPHGQANTSSIQVGWKLREAHIPLVRQFQVHYQKVASDYLQYGPLLHANARDFKVGNLVADTYYKVCLVVFGSNKMDYRQCTEASTTNWQLPISVGSSIGALLALSVIVLIVLLSRCKFSSRNGGKKSKSSTRYDTMTSMYHDDQSTIHGNDYDFMYQFDDEALYEVPLDASMRTSS